MTDSESVLRVLVVDDEMPARLRLRDLLGDIREAVPNDLVGGLSNGHEAERFLETRAVDVVLTDIHMPGLDGMAFARRLRERPDAPAVVFVTAYDEHALQAFDAAAVDYLVKPVTATRLREALERVRARMRAAPAAAAAAAVAPGLDDVAPLDCKEIQPVHSEGDQPWDFFGRDDAKAETPVLWPPHVKS